MESIKNVHLLPTSKPSRLLYSGNNKNLLFSKEPISFRTFERSPQNIYITNSEEIKEGDWYFFNYQIIKCENPDLTKIPIVTKNYCKKIILTTDQDLIANGVQAIDDDFLEWFVKNPSREWVEITKDKIRHDKEFNDISHWNIYKYKIIIPQEKSKQETLEEAAERLFKEFQIENPIVPNNNIRPFKLGFIKSAKWQAERMYSEAIEFAEWIRIKDFQTTSKNNWIGLDMKYYTTQELFEQFKKK